MLFLFRGRVYLCNSRGFPKYTLMFTAKNLLILASMHLISIHIQYKSFPIVLEKWWWTGEDWHCGPFIQPYEGTYVVKTYGKTILRTFVSRMLLFAFWLKLKVFPRMCLQSAKIFNFLSALSRMLMSTEPLLLFNSSGHGCQMSPANRSEAFWDSWVVSQGVLRQLHSSRTLAIIYNGGEKETGMIRLLLKYENCRFDTIWLWECEVSVSLLQQTIELLYLLSAWEGVKRLNIVTYGLNVQPHWV